MGIFGRWRRDGEKQGSAYEVLVIVHIKLEIISPPWKSAYEHRLCYFESDQNHILSMGSNLPHPSSGSAFSSSDKVARF